jgi:hypothetical protein
VKFLVTMAEPGHYARWAGLTDEGRAGAFAAFEKYAAAVAERGEVLAGEGLAHPGEARTVGPGSGESRAVTDGPYAETSEQIGGFFLVELPDLEAAVATSRLLPEAFSVEVRPVVAG